MLNDTATVTFSGTKYFQFGYWYFFRYQILPVPVPRLFSDTSSDTTRTNEEFPCTHYESSKFLDFGDENQFRYHIFPVSDFFQYPQNKWKFPGTGNSPYRNVTLWWLPAFIFLQRAREGLRLDAEVSAREISFTDFSPKTTKTSAQSKTPKDLKVILLMFCFSPFCTVILFAWLSELPQKLAQPPSQ